jgi:hypothetical protein
MRLSERASSKYFNSYIYIIIYSKFLRAPRNGAKIIIKKQLNGRQMAAKLGMKSK